MYCIRRTGLVQTEAYAYCI